MMAPHAHILIWLVERMQPDQIDDITFVQIPDPETDPDQHVFVITNMSHGPCGVINPQSTCMVDGKCSKRYPRNLTAETIPGNDGYPLYRRRSSDDGARTITVKVKGNDFLVDNSWVVPYSPLLSKLCKAHCNVEYCNSLNSIKYICKYVAKGSDNDEITRYQREREYDKNALRQLVRTNVPLLNPQQKEVYDTVMKAIDDENVGMFFLHAPSLILATVRAISEIAVAVVSSLIAATLLEGCLTAYSSLKLPLNLQAVEEPTCSIAKH
ncbi:uncharacterized protein LOC118749774 [Rhagoletis pomonella]|uniref:uncharacterized protein LOC118749774 n=1 Tax=Rhagoletis pomonella TaxID=28610 RepID=UPI00177B00B4|nr:uncharacterized protein LOC118749774 [Rhagoletis pomonella]